MKLKLLLTGCAFFSAGSLRAQGGTWEWVRGSNMLNPPIVYGTQGVAAPGNTPDGFYEAAFWEDLQGNFWVFGGLDNNHIETSDLWKYDPVANEWTWMKGPGTEGTGGVYGTQGVPAMSNNPGARGYAMHSWTDLNGDLWLFGGYATDGFGGYEPSNDLWRYNIASNEWTWMKGSNTVGAADVYGTLQVPAVSNTPGGRCEGNDDWVDANNNLWFFGGQAVSFGFYNDMWQYSVSTNNWTWMNGPQGTASIGSYGTEGVEASTNVPPTRGGYTRWENANDGYFYLFGGIDFSSGLIYSDVWRYNTNTNYWTWIAGENTPASTGQYGQYCTDNGKTGPAARYECRTPQTIGCSHVFVMFGGFANTADDTYNDLWTFNTSTLNWRWVSGASTMDGAGNYGTMGVPSTSNLPPARGGSCGWIDNAGNFWLFSGMEPTSTGKYNDVWKFTPDPTCIGQQLSGGIVTTLPTNTICKGDTLALHIQGDSSISIYPSAYAHIIDSANALLYPDSTTTYVLTGPSACAISDTARVTVLVNHPGTFNYSLSDSDVCAGNAATLTLYGVSGVSIFPGTGVQWSDTAHAQLYPTDTTTYLVTTGTSICGTPDTGRVTVNVIPASPVIVFAADTNLCYETQALFTVQGLTNVQFSPGYSPVWVDSIHALIGPLYYNSTVTVSGLNSCGASYSRVFNFTVSNSYGTINYTLSPPVVCQGDSSLLTLIGASHGYAVPTNLITWIDSSHAWLHADTTTTFVLTAYSPTCGGYITTSVNLKVLQAGIINYTISDTTLCTGGMDAFLYIYGANNIQISPYTYTLTYTDSIDAVITLYPSVTTTYTFTATSTCGGTYTQDLTIHTSPYPSYTISPSSICLGDSSHLHLIGIGNPQITPTTGVTWIDAADLWLAPDTNTEYVITGNSCEGPVTYYINLNVFTPGVLNYTLTDSSICQGGEAYLTTGGAINQIISPNGYLYELDSSHYYAYLYPTQTTTYTVSGTSVCGGPVSASFTVTVEPYPTPILGSGTICQGDSTTLAVLGLQNAQITPVNGVRWINAQLAELSPDSTTEYLITGTSCDGVFDEYVTLNVVNGIGLDYTVSDSELCPGSDAYVTTSGARNMALYPIGSGTLYMLDSTDFYTFLYPTVTTTYTLTGTSICTGATVSASFTIHVDNSWGGMTFSNPVGCSGGTTTITFNGLTNINMYPVNNIAWLNSNQVKVTIDSTTTYTVEGYTPCFNFFDTVFTIGVLSESVQISTNRPKFCPGDSAQICATPGFLVYNWSSGDTGECIKTKDIGNYYVTVSDNGNCTAVSNEVTLSEYALSPVTISTNGDTLTGYTADAYQWYFDGSPIPGATSATYIAIVKGTYTLQITDTNGCQATSSPVVISGLGELSESSISVYPNPTNSSWLLTVDTRLVGSAIELYDATGQIVLKSEIRNPQSEISAPGLASGIYELRIVSQQYYFARKLVKM